MSNSNRNVRERLMDRAVISIIVTLVVVAIIFPRVNSELLTPYVNLVPLYPDRPSCRELPAPLGGNRRSLLAYELDTTDALQLELSAPAQIPLGSLAEVRVTFRNTSSAPIILHFPNFPDPEYLITTAPESQALNFLLEFNGFNVGEPGRFYQPPLGFNSSTLHLLGPRSSCIQAIALGERLAGIGVNTPGRARMRARYMNTSPGNAPTGFPDPAIATAIPEYRVTQGVWVGEATSNEESFEIVLPGAAQPPQ